MPRGWLDGRGNRVEPACSGQLPRKGPPMLPLLLALLQISSANPAATTGPIVSPPHGSGDSLSGFESRTAWLGAAACAPTLVDFDSIPSGTLISSQLASSGIALVSGTSFAPTDPFVTASTALPFPMFTAGTLPSEPNFLSNNLSGPVYATGALHFQLTAPTTAIGAFVADGSPLGGFEIEVFSGGSSLGFISVPPRTLPSSFVGVVSSQPFDTAVFRASHFQDSWGLDSLELCAGAPVTVYCTAKTTSSGCVPSISATGVPSTAGAFMVRCSQVQTGQQGVMLYSTNGQAAISFQGGTLCVMPPVLRTPVQAAGGVGPCEGSLAFDFSAHYLSGIDPVLVPGQQVWAQYWFRDPGDPFGTGLSDALEFTLL